MVDIESGYVYYPPTGDDGFDAGHGEEIFTLTAERSGECDFTIAYARTWEFSNFDRYAKDGGYVISIPIRVYGLDNDDKNDKKAKPENKPAKKKEPFDPEEGRKAFKIIGIFAWIRAWNLFDIVAYLPQAISYSVTRNDWTHGYRWRWITLYWSHIVGWICSLPTMGAWTYLTIWAIKQYNKEELDGDDDETLLAKTGKYLLGSTFNDPPDSCKYEWYRDQYPITCFGWEPVSFNDPDDPCNDEWYRDQYPLSCIGWELGNIGDDYIDAGGSAVGFGLIMLIMTAVTALGFEVSAWIVYYIFYKDAAEYGAYLADDDYDFGDFNEF